MQALVIRRLLYSSSFNLGLGLFQDSSGLTVKAIFRLEFLSMPANLVKPLEVEVSSLDLHYV